MITRDNFFSTVQSNGHRVRPMCTERELIRFFFEKTARNRISRFEQSCVIAPATKAGGS